MPEQIVHSEEERDAQFDANFEMLRNSEVGVILGEAYEVAVSLDPRLRDIEIVEIDDPNEKRYGHATPSWKSESGKHQIHARLSDLDGTLTHYQKAMDEAPGAIAMIAERMGIDPSQVTPQLMFTQSVMHEMGHITEFMDYQDRPEELRDRQKREKAALPIGNATAGQLMQLDSPARQLIDANWDEVRAHTGAESAEHLIQMQSEAYRVMTSEAHADSFAADVFLTNPHMYDQLMQPTVDPYRNYPTGLPQAA